VCISVVFEVKEREEGKGRQAVEGRTNEMKVTGYDRKAGTTQKYRKRE
jgi:hypothetical protein